MVVICNNLWSQIIILSPQVQFCSPIYLTSGNLHFKMSNTEKSMELDHRSSSINELGDVKLLLNKLFN